jgi:hypothetical protein
MYGPSQQNHEMIQLSNLVCKHECEIECDLKTKKQHLESPQVLMFDYSLPI